MLFSFLAGLKSFILSPFSDFRHARAYPQDEKPDSHKYIRGNPEDRAPCPGLNSLANHGFIPRDGKNISIPQLERALQLGLCTSPALAFTITRQLEEVLDPKTKTFCLSDLRTHNMIEHDASFTRYDFRQGDNFTFQPALFEAMINDAKGGPLTVKSLAKTYLRRKKESRAIGSPGLPLKLRITGLLQAVAVLNAAGVDGVIPLDVAKSFYVEERLPDNVFVYHQKSNTRGLLYWAWKLLLEINFRI